MNLGGSLGKSGNYLGTQLRPTHGFTLHVRFNDTRSTIFDLYLYDRSTFRTLATVTLDPPTGLQPLVLGAKDMPFRRRAGLGRYLQLVPEAGRVFPLRVCVRPPHW